MFILERKLKQFFSMFLRLAFSVSSSINRLKNRGYKSLTSFKVMGILTVCLLFLAGCFYVLTRVSIHDEEEMFETIDEQLSRSEKAELVKKAEKYLLNSLKFFHDHSDVLSLDAVLSTNFIIGYANSGRLANSEEILVMQKSVLKKMAPIWAGRLGERMFEEAEMASKLRFAEERPKKLKMTYAQDWSNYEENANYYLQGLCFREVLETCEMSDVCREKYSHVDDVMYTLTHDILYFILRMKQGCEDQPELIEQFCQRSWEEAHRTWNLLHVKKRDTFCLFDMFIEQMTFCAMLGYSQFLKPSWMTYALDHMENGYCIIKSIDLTQEFTPGLVCHHNISFSQDAMAWKLGIIDGCADHTTALMHILLAHFLFLESPAEKLNRRDDFFVNVH